MLSDTQIETLTYIFERMEGGDNKITAWEKSFMEDQKQRFDKYQENTRFSDRQWRVILKIEQNLVEGRL